MNTSNTSPIDIPSLILRILSTALFLLVFYGITVGQTTYTFTGEADDRYENPANWIPAYPGTEIPANSIVFIEGIAIAHAEILVSGILHIGAGASLEIESASLSIHSSGKLMNDGDLLAPSIQNAGMINNNLAATLNAGTLISTSGAMINNLMAAQLLVQGNLYNGGLFNNYSFCAVQGNFLNAFSFSEMPNSEMKISGQHIEQLIAHDDDRLTLNAR